MDTWVLWALFLSIGLATFMIRLSFILLHGRLQGAMVRYQPILTLLPPAILAALCAPSILFNKQVEAEKLDFTQLIAALVTIVLAKYCRSLLWPIIGGMGCLWIIRWVL